MEAESVRLFGEIRESLARLEKGQAEVAKKVSSIAKRLDTTDKKVSSIAKRLDTTNKELADLTEKVGWTYENSEKTLETLLSSSERGYSSPRGQGQGQKMVAKSRR